jgi:uncharacterized membrane protein
VADANSMDLLARLRSSFVAGVVLIAPLAVTVFVLQFVFTRLTALLRPVVVEIRPTLAATLGLPDVTLIAQVLAAVLIALVVTLVGYVASIGVGQRLFGSFERGVRLLPLVRTIYFGVRQVSESLSERSDGFDSVVLVEFHRRGAYSIGFVTNEAPEATREATGERLYTVFVPNAPNPTAGALLMLPESDIHQVDIPVRRGIRLLVTTGLSADEDDDALPPGTVVDPEHDPGGDRDRDAPSPGPGAEG